MYSHPGQSSFVEATAYLLYDAETAPFTVGATLSGGTSLATAIIVSVTDFGTDGVLGIRNIVNGPFENNEALVDDGATPGAAVANGTIGEVFLQYDSGVGAFVVGNTVTNDVSAATATVRGHQDDGATGNLVLENQTAEFLTTEGMTEGANTGDVLGAQTFGASGVVGQKVFSYSIKTDGVVIARLRFYKDASLTDQIWEDVVLGADLNRPFTFSQNGPMGNPAGLGATVYAEIKGGLSSAYIIYD